MFNFRKESKQLYHLNQLNPPQVRTSSHISAHIFKASHSTFPKASLIFPSNPDHQNRFPVDGNVFSQNQSFRSLFHYLQVQPVRTPHSMRIFPSHRPGTSVLHPSSSLAE